MSLPNLSFPALLQEFFQRRLVTERGVSAHTIASYRDSFGLLLRYAESRSGRVASTLTVQDLDAPMILSFLDHLESERECGARTRNLRLTAIRSFMRYVSIRDPASLPIAQRVLAIASKRFDRPILEFLSRDEIQTLLDAPDRDTWSGQRDAALFAVLYNTGAGVSEIIRLQICDVLLDRAYALHLHGKGRKERVIPLWKSTAAQQLNCALGFDVSTTRPKHPYSRIALATPCPDLVSSTACASQSIKHRSTVHPF